MRQLKKNIWPYQIVMKNEPTQNGIFMQPPADQESMDKWCYRTLGKRFQDWYGYNTDNNSKRVYAFKDEATLLVFKLTWGNRACSR